MLESIGRYRRETFVSTIFDNRQLIKKSLYPSTGYFGYQDEHTYHAIRVHGSNHGINAHTDLFCVGVCIFPIPNGKGVMKMTYSKEQREHIEFAFDAFCRAVLRHEFINTLRDKRRQSQHEISLDYLHDEKCFDVSVTDEYFVKQDKPTTFTVCSKAVIVDNEQLGQALKRLSEAKRELILMYFFLRYTDEQIGKLYGRNRSTIQYRRHAALKQLRKEMEALQDVE